jgi:predicted glycogen debranching enzyme
VLPVWTYALGDGLLERRVWMSDGANTTYVMYRLVRGVQAVDLEIIPLVTYRDFHTLRSGGGWRPSAEAQPRGVLVRADSGAVPFRVLADGGEFVAGGNWYWNFRHREETSRGLDDRSDLYAPGTFRAQVPPGGMVTLMATTETSTQPAGARSLAAAQERQRQLLAAAGAARGQPIVRQLTLAADQFLVRRGPASDSEKTVIAGYHWFNDWGRDTMIVLPGLALCTGRAGDAARILRSFSRYVRNGLIPNNFPDQPDVDPGYNTADASLWYVHAVGAYDEATGDRGLADDLLPVLRGIIDGHVRGASYGIGVDPGDGLLRAEAPGVQLTWMDAKVGGWVVTPRTGKPVEINALWYNALRTLAALLAARDASEGERYEAMAERTREAFRRRFVRPESPSLADVVDGPDGDDLTPRPNQVFALSLPYPLLDGAAAAPVLDEVGRLLLTSLGLRSLSPAAPGYRGIYGGGVAQRDGAYHQGTAWAWLIGAYAEAHYRLHGDAAAALEFLRPFARHLSDAGLGSISEIFDGDPPHLPRGCIAQAWSVAEVLRVWRKLTREAQRRRSSAMMGE